MLVHATAIAWADRAVLLMGPSGSGKSDLALRAVAAGAALIADDLVRVLFLDTMLHAAAPDAAEPRLAVRGIGVIAPKRWSAAQPLSLCVQLAPTPVANTLEPNIGKAGPWHGRFVPQILLNPFEPSSVLKLELALERFGL